MYVKNCWYVAAWNYELKNQQLYSCTIINQPLVIYRRDDGTCVAMEDRCCHRALPLSLGRLEGNDLRCMYHGLKFAPSGQCIEMPGQERIPNNACVKTYPVVEAHSWIWVWMGEPEKADPNLIPTCKALDTPGMESRSGHIEYETNYELINDNLLDFSHLGYVHPTSFGASEDWAYTRPKITRLERGIRIERWVKNQPPAFVPHEGPVDIWNAYDFMLPGILCMTSYATAAGGADANSDAAPDPHKSPILFDFNSYQAVTPISDTKSRYSFSVLMPTERAGNGLLEGFWAGTRQAFEEDRIVIEAQHKSMKLDPARKLVPSIYDAALGQFQWIIDKLIREEREATLLASEG